MGVDDRFVEGVGVDLDCVCHREGVLHNKRRAVVGLELSLEIFRICRSDPSPDLQTAQCALPELCNRSRRDEADTADVVWKRQPDLLIDRNWSRVELLTSVQGVDVELHVSPWSRRCLRHSTDLPEHGRVVLHHTCTVEADLHLRNLCVLALSPGITVLTNAVHTLRSGWHEDRIRHRSVTGVVVELCKDPGVHLVETLALSCWQCPQHATGVDDDWSELTLLVFACDRGLDIPRLAVHKLVARTEVGRIEAELSCVGPSVVRRNFSDRRIGSRPSRVCLNCRSRERTRDDIPALQPASSFGLLRQDEAVRNNHADVVSESIPASLDWTNEEW